MRDQYKAWIDSNVNDGGYGYCFEATRRMVEDFPELVRVRGHYYCHTWGERGHWWCKTASGEIVDPTAMQFPSKGYGEYIEWDESQQEPTGMCPNCAGLCYDGGTCCSENCHIEYAAYCTNPFA